MYSIAINWSVLNCIAMHSIFMSLVLYCIELYCMVLYRTILCCITTQSVVSFNYATMHCIISYFIVIALLSIVLYYIVLYRIVPYCNDCIVLHYNVFHYILQCWTMFRATLHRSCTIKLKLNQHDKLPATNAAVRNSCCTVICVTGDKLK